MDELVRPREEIHSKDRHSDEEIHERLLQQGGNNVDNVSDDGASHDDSMQRNDTSNAVSAVCSTIYRRRGIMYGLATGVSGGLQMAIVGWLRSSISPYQIMLWRGIMFLLPVGFISWEAGNDYTIADMIYYIGFGFFNALGVLLGFVSLQLAQVGNATAIAFNLPIPATIAGFFVLGERITAYDILLFAINLIGVVLVSKPPFIFSGAGDSLDVDEFFGAMIAVAGLLCIVTSVIFSRKLAYRERSDPALTTVTPGMASVFLCAGVILYTQSWDKSSTLLEMLAILSAGICGLLGNVFLISALKLESVLVVSVMFTSCVPVSFLLGVWIVQEIPDLVSIVGAFLVLASTCACLFK